MATEVDRSLPELILAPGTTITVTLDDALAKCTRLNVYGVSPAPNREEESAPVVPLFVYSTPT